MSARDIQGQIEQLERELHNKTPMAAIVNVLHVLRLAAAAIDRLEAMHHPGEYHGVGHATMRELTPEEWNAAGIRPRRREMGPAPGSRPLRPGPLPAITDPEQLVRDLWAEGPPELTPLLRDLLQRRGIELDDILTAPRREAGESLWPRLDTPRPRTSP